MELEDLFKEQRRILEPAISDLRNMAENLEDLLRDTSSMMEPSEYCAPVGTEAERESGQIWPGEWVDATGYCVWYFNKWWHTGADLNLNSPKWDADRHSPIYSIAKGEVYAIRKFDGWEWVVCIKHDECLSRYAHVEDIQVREGEKVEMGQFIAKIGNAGGRYPYHLHFDIARLDARMLKYPGDWPGADIIRVLKDYLDPKEFLKAHV
jgi:murein DD-endopeptidase MepM/ murein hydrolase activator NlpD